MFCIAAKLVQIAVRGEKTIMVEKISLVKVAEKSN